jgi:glycosyltransferase involved in cell wall biosynthesis
LKICFISNCSRIGGAERVLLETIDIFRERDIDCCVLLPGEGVFAQELLRRGIPYAIVRSASLTSSGKPSPWGRVKAAIRLAVVIPLLMRKIITWKCDVVYSNTLLAGHGAIAARLLRKPHIWHLHEFGKEDHGFSFYFGEDFSCKTVGRLSSMCIVVSKALASKYAMYIKPSRLIVVYPSMGLVLESGAPTLEVPPALPQPNGRFRCIIVGGVFEGKRQEDAVQAMKLLVDSGVNAELVIVGGAEQPRYREYLEQIIGQTGPLRDHVIFTGEIRDARPFMQTTDVLLMCSRSEAFGRVTIEAMLAGKAVIGAANGATPELVRDGFNGLLYKVGDPVDLAGKIRYLYDNPSIARGFGENGKQWAHSIFTKERYAGELIDILKTLQESE